MKGLRLAVAAVVGAAALALLLPRAADDVSSPDPGPTSGAATRAPAEATAVPPAPSPTLSPSASAPRPSPESPVPNAPGPPPGLPARFTLVDALDGRPVAGDVVEPYVEHGTQSLSVGIAPPAGYLVWETPSWFGRLARHARGVRWTHPLHREALVRVHLVAPYGKPARDARVGRFRIDGRVGVARPDEHDPTRVRGVPSFPGEALEIEAGWLPLEEEGPEGDRALGEGPFEGDVAFVASETVVLSESPSVETEAWIHLPPRPQGTLPVLDRIETDNDMPYEESIGEAGEDDGFGALRVLVRGRDGLPLPSAFVRVEGVGDRESDARGTAAFPRVPVGSLRVALAEPGRTWTTAVADVARDRTAEVVLREAAGATLVVEVVDETGAPARFPRVEVLPESGTYLVDLDDGGVQRLDPFGDVAGRRTFLRVPAGEVVVRASAGRRRGEASVRVVEGGEHRVRVEVRPP